MLGPIKTPRVTGLRPLTSTTPTPTGWPFDLNASESYATTTYSDLSFWQSTTHNLPFQNLNDTDFRELVEPNPNFNNVLPHNPIDADQLKMKHFKQLSNDTGVFNNDSDPDKFMSSNLDMVDPVCEYYNSDDLYNIMMGTEQFLKILFSNINSIPHKYELLCEEFSEIRRL